MLKDLTLGLVQDVLWREGGGYTRDEAVLMSHTLFLQGLRLLFNRQPTLCRQRVALLQCVLKWQEHLLAVKSASPSAS